MSVTFAVMAPPLFGHGVRTGVVLGAAARPLGPLLLVARAVSAPPSGVPP